jgi:hypothetical protein
MEQASKESKEPGEVLAKPAGTIVRTPAEVRFRRASCLAEVATDELSGNVNQSTTAGLVWFSCTLATACRAPYIDATLLRHVAGSSIPTCIQCPLLSNKSKLVSSSKKNTRTGSTLKRIK